MSQRLAVFMTGVACASLAAGAQAQTAAAPANSGATTGVEEIIVTAEKRNERLVEAPLSVVAIGAGQLTKAGVNNVLDLTQVVSGLRFDKSGNYIAPTIRGITSLNSGPGQLANIGIYTDGFYKPLPEGTDFDLIDISGVEVLKGPQGTVFGANATGGAILVQTSDPDFDRTQLRGKLSYGRFNDARGQVFAETPLGDKVAVNISLAGHREDGWRRNLFTGKTVGETKTWQVRNKWRFQATDDLEFQFTFEHSDVNNPDATLFNSYLGRSNGALTPGVVVASGARQTSNDTPAVQHNITNGAFLRTRLDLQDVTLTSYTSWQRQTTKQQFDADGSSAPITGINFPQKQRALIQEFDLASSGQTRFKWVAGVFGMSIDTDMQLRIPANFDLIKAKVSSDLLAAFADASYNVVSNLYVGVGARYSTEKIGEDYQLFLFPAPLSAKKRFNSFTPRATVRYEFDRNTSLYGSFSRGHSQANFNALGLSPIPVKPESVDAYEVGFKSHTSRMQFEIAAFRYSYKNFQVTAFNTNNAVVLLNAPKAKIYGLDGHLNYKLTDELRIDLGAAYTHGEYSEFPDAARNVFVGGGAPAPIGVPAGIILKPGVNQFQQDASGNQMPRSPHFSGNAGIYYNHVLASGAAIDASANYSYSSKIYFDPFGPIGGPKQSGYGLLNLRAGWTTSDQRWTFSVYGRNVTNEKYLDAVVSESTGFLGHWGHPATYGAEVSFAL